MAITILAPAPAVPYQLQFGSDDEDPEDGGVDLKGDFGMRPVKRARHSSAKDLVTPGETVTDDPQWMRYEMLYNFGGRMGKSANFASEATAHTLHLPAQKSLQQSRVRSRKPTNCSRSDLYEQDILLRLEI